MNEANEPVLGHGRLQHALFWLLATLLLAGGYWLNMIAFLGEEWLSRAGCLVVILGIWSGLGGIVQERVLLSRLQLRHRLAVARTRRRLRRQRVDAERIDSEVAELDKAFEGLAKQLSHTLRLSVGILEVSLLITGTLLWGFGDLVPVWGLHGG